MSASDVQTLIRRLTDQDKMLEQILGRVSALEQKVAITEALEEAERKRHAHTLSAAVVGGAAVLGVVLTEVLHLLFG